MESVFLRYKGAEFYVTEEGLKEIRALVMRYRICGKCKLPYDIDNLRPCVGFNLCMLCLLNQQPDLTFLEVQSINDDGEAMYAFVDSKGTVYTSRENSSTEAIADVRYSLMHSGFTVPATYKPFKATESVRLDSYHMHIVGDLNNSVVVLTYNDYYAKISTQFLLYKHGSYKELTRRGEGKAMIDRARATLESTKRNGRYYIEGREVWTVSDYEVYRLVAKLESAIHTISLQVAPPPVEEPRDKERDEAEDEAIEQSLQVEETSQDSTSEPLQESQEQPKRGKRGRLSVVPNEGTTQTEEATNAETTQPMQQEENEGQPIRDLGEPGQDMEVPSAEEVQAGSNE